MLVEYEKDFSEAIVLHSDVIELSIKKIVKNKNRYQLLTKNSNIPWFFIAIIHIMECDGDFSKHIHNGDSLKKKTINVPKDRPLLPPNDEKGYTWEESCLDCIEYKDWDKIKVWDFNTICFQWERNNGFGYNKLGLPSPYLWSFTNKYTSGKYVSDGKFDAKAVSKQPGCLAIYKKMLDKKII